MMRRQPPGSGEAMPEMRSAGPARSAIEAAGTTRMSAVETANARLRGMPRRRSSRKAMPPPGRCAPGTRAPIATAAVEICRLSEY